MLGARFLFRMVAGVVVFALGMSAVATPIEPTVEDLKARLATASVGDRPHLCVEIAQKQLAAVDKLYAAGDLDKGQAALADVVTYSESARDNAIQSRKYQKQSEIAVRAMTRKLTELLHSLGHDDQGPVQDAVRRLQQVRDDLLKAMFPKGAK
jgi:hypothetical protein